MTPASSQLHDPFAVGANWRYDPVVSLNKRCDFVPDVGRGLQEGRSHPEITEIRGHISSWLAEEQPSGDVTP